MAALPTVICKYCGKRFPKDGTVEYIKVKNEYAHKACAEDQDNEAALYNQVFATASKYLHDTYRPKAVERSLDRMLKEEKTALGIIKSLNYWYEVKQGDYTKANGGINIVDYIYDDAQKYYENLEKIHEANKEVNEAYISNLKTSTYHVRLKPIQKPKRVKLFDLQ